METLKYVLIFIVTATIMALLLKAFGLYFALAFPLLFFIYLIIAKKRNT